ncbi:hypothetical protein Tco_0821820 [Tanacetum coccineum]|uniref:Uncharacterized protein n=1 Tax=Tanacetum coccineum TaxID=301880 RepID=A0ABQ5ADA9_9ASTR
MPEETEWDYLEPPIGLGGVTVVSVGVFLDLGLLLFLESALEASGPSIIWAINSILVDEQNVLKSKVKGLCPFKTENLMRNSLSRRFSGSSFDGKGSKATALLQNSLRKF